MANRLLQASLCLALLAGCRPQSPEARIRKAFAACVKAVEAGDAAGATAELSPGFEGPDGMDRGAARLYLAAILRRERVGVSVVSQRLAVRGPEALQSVDLLLTGRGAGEILPGDGSRKALLVRWELRDGEWMIREVQEASQGS
jgi:hypothetical protein